MLAIPLGTLAMQPRPGCCAADNQNAEKTAIAAAAARTPAAAAAAAADGELHDVCPCDCLTMLAGKVRVYCRGARLALREFLAAFRTCRAYRLQVSWLTAAGLIQLLAYSCWPNTALTYSCWPNAALTYSTGL